MSLPNILFPKDWNHSNEAGIGNIIRGPKADGTMPDGLIAGVILASYPIWPDDRGYFLEVTRIGQGLSGAFPIESTQVSAALSYAGTIKAFHYHCHQTDFWVPVMGMFQVGLVDLRQDSPTFGLRNTIYCGGLKPMQVIIPPGIGHGYKVIGPDSGMLVYVTDRHYNPADEGRIAHNDPKINYDWELQHK